MLLRSFVTVLLALAALACTEDPSETASSGPPGPTGPTTVLTYRVPGVPATEELAGAVESRLRSIPEVTGVGVLSTGALDVRIGSPAGGGVLRRVKSLLARQGTLEFLAVAPASSEARERARREEMADEYPGPPKGTRWVASRHDGREDRLLEVPSGPDADRFRGEDLDPETLEARPGSSSGYGWVVGFAVRDDRKDAFRRFTGRILKRQLAIVVDGAIESAPTVQEELADKAQIMGGGIGGFSKAEAEDLVAILRSVPLTAEIELVSEQTEGD